MNESDQMQFSLSAQRLDNQRSKVAAKDVELTIDTSASGRMDALNPVELLMAALAACMVKGINRVSETLGIEYSSLNMELKAQRPIDEARLEQIEYLITLGSTVSQDKLDLLNKNLINHGTIFNTVKSGTNLFGKIVAYA